LHPDRARAAIETSFCIAQTLPSLSYPGSRRPQLRAPPACYVADAHVVDGFALDTDRQSIAARHEERGDLRGGLLFLRYERLARGARSSRRADHVRYFEIFVIVDRLPRHMFLRVKPMLQIDAIELSLRIRAAPDHHPSETCILAAIIRASVSVGPPAANGNTIVIGRDGYVSQGAGPAAF